MTDQGPQPPWHAAFPEPRNKSPNKLSRETVLSWLQEDKIPGKSYLIVDLRRNDYEGGTIRGSLNLPAQTLYPTLPTLLELCKNSEVRDVVFYCGSSAGRGTRVAGWFDDLLKDRGVTECTSSILEGGIKGWVAAGEGYTEHMDGYIAEHWQQQTKA